MHLVFLYVCTCKHMCVVVHILSVLYLYVCVHVCKHMLIVFLHVDVYVCACERAYWK